MTAIIQVHINQKPHSLPAGATLADAITLLQARQPFAAAVNLRFVPRAAHVSHALADGDRIEIIAPVTGG
jgi:sulfur carrier protein